MMILDLVNEFHFQNDKVAKRDDKFFQSLPKIQKRKY